MFLFFLFQIARFNKASTWSLPQVINPHWASNEFVDHLTSSWFILHHCGSSYIVVDHLTSLWIMLHRCGLCYIVVDYVTSLWIMLHRRGLFNIIHHCGLLLLWIIWIIITAAAKDG